MSLTDVRILATRRKLLERKLANGFQYAESRHPVSLLSLTDEALVDERRQVLKDVKLAIGIDDGFGPLQSEATCEHGQTTEEALLLRREQVIAPGDGVTQRALPFWGIVRSA